MGTCIHGAEAGATGALSAERGHSEQLANTFMLQATPEGSVIGGRCAGKAHEQETAPARSHVGAVGVMLHERLGYSVVLGLLDAVHPLTPNLPEYRLYLVHFLVQGGQAGVCLREFVFALLLEFPDLFVDV